MSIEQEIINSISEGLDITAELAELNPRDKGKYYDIICPECRKPEAYIYKDSKFISCNRKEKCKYSMPLFSYLFKQETGRGKTSQEALIELAKRAGFKLPGNNNYNTENIQKIKDVEILLERLLKYFIEGLEKPAGAKVKKYLHGRGYSDKEIKEMQLGYFPPKDKILKAIKESNISESTFNDSGLNTIDGNIHSLAIPYRNYTGRITGYIVRSLLSDKELKEINEKKYRYNSGLKLDSLFNLHLHRGNDTAIIVEGFLDSLILNVRGFKPGAIAIGGSTINNQQIETLKKCNLKYLYLALDNEKSGIDGTEQCIKKITQAGLKAFVLPPLDSSLHDKDTNPGAIKDPDQFVKEKGIEEFNKLYKQAVKHVTWEANRIINKYDLNDTLEREKFIDEVIAYDRPLNELEGEEFFKIISDETGLSIESFLSVRESYLEKKAQREKAREMQTATGKIQMLLHEGKYIEAEELMQSTAREINKNIFVNSEPLHTFLLNKREKDSNRKEELLGYNLTQFRQIAKDIDGLQPGFYILGAYTNVGKTAFLANLMLDLLATNKGTTAFYATLDDSRNIIVNRLLAIQSGLPINTIQKSIDNKQHKKDLEEAYSKLIDYSEGSRLSIKDIAEITDINTLEREIIKLHEVNSKLIVFIDGLYNLDTGKATKGRREEGIELANGIKRLSDTFNIPIICTGELRKPDQKASKKKAPTIDDLMETGKFGYNANMTWLLYPEESNEDEFNKENISNLNLKPAKNKLSHIKRIEIIRFEKANNRMNIVEDKIETIRNETSDKKKKIEGLF